MIDLGEGDFLSARVAHVTGGRGVNRVVDAVRGDGFIDAVRTLMSERRIHVVGLAGGVSAIGINRLLLRNVAVVGVAWGPFLEWVHEP